MLPQHSHLIVIIVTHPYIRRPVVIRVRMCTEKTPVYLNDTHIWIRLEVLSVVFKSTVNHDEYNVAPFNVDTSVRVRFKGAVADVDCILSAAAPSDQSVNSIAAHAAVVQAQCLIGSQVSLDSVLEAVFNHTVFE